MRLSYCATKNKFLTYSFTTLTQVILIFTFLIVFFFDYVNQVEKQAFITQINSAVDNLTSDLQNILPRHNYQPVIDSINSEIKTIQKDANHTEIDNTNDNLKNISFEIILSMVAGFSVFVTIITLTNHCLPLLSTFKESVLSLGFVALTEFIFLQIVAKQYVSADPNLIRYGISSTLYNEAEKFLKN